MTQNNNVKLRNEKFGQKVVDALKKRHFDAFYCDTKEDALKKAVELISKDNSISSGGSTTLNEIGLIDYLVDNGYNISVRDRAKTPEEKEEISRQAMLADVYFMSTNAISQDGELVNIDGLGNRVAALAYGPKNIIVITGMNKIAQNLEDAYSRARNTAAPINLQRIASSNTHTETPCLYTGICADCKSTSSICAQIVTTRLCRPAGRIKVILVNENLGF